jgi:hypothetical protein
MMHRIALGVPPARDATEEEAKAFSDRPSIRMYSKDVALYDHIDIVYTDDGRTMALMVGEPQNGDPVVWDAELTIEHVLKHFEE